MAEQQAPAAGSAEELFLDNAMQDPNVMAALEGKSAEERAVIMRQLFQDYAGAGALNSEAMSQADTLRNGDMPQGVQVGGQYVASNPMSHVAKLMNQYTGQRDYNAAKDKQQGLSDDRTSGLQWAAGTKAGLNQPTQTVTPEPFTHTGNDVRDEQQMMRIAALRNQQG